MSEGVIDPLQAIDVTKDVANALLRMKTVQIGRERMAIVQPGQLVDPTLSICAILFRFRRSAVMKCPSVS